MEDMQPCSLAPWKDAWKDLSDAERLGCLRKNKPFGTCFFSGICFLSATGVIFHSTPTKKWINVGLNKKTTSFAIKTILMSQKSFQKKRKGGFEDLLFSNVYRQQIEGFDPKCLTCIYTIKMGWRKTTNCIWGFPKIVVPEHGWVIMENPIKMDDSGVPTLKETTI